MQVSDTIIIPLVPPRAYWMNFKQDVNSLSKLSKEKSLSLEMLAEIISVTL